MGIEGRKYDDSSWHIGGAFPQHQPPEHGTFRMATYFAGVIRRGSSDSEFVRTEMPMPIEDSDLGAALCVMEQMDASVVGSSARFVRLTQP